MEASKVDIYLVLYSQAVFKGTSPAKKPRENSRPESVYPVFRSLLVARFTFTSVPTPARM